MSEESGARCGRAGEPVERLEAGGWELVEETTETLFELSAARVLGHTRVYGDAALRRAVREASGVDQLCRFFFATVLEFSPPLSSGVAPVVKPTVASEARREFANDLRQRGFVNVDRGRTRNVRVDAGVRARLTDYRSVYPLRAGDASVDLRVRGLLAVWLDEEFHVAGGAYPESGLADLLADADVEPDGAAYREELLDLIRAVE
ncbi:hypothetical protein BRC93_05375 [Halobacteriales archaeon QS_5_70_15]|jgi:hypothetical protein|nr:MAG: hypothetical protein BRC93_05375 [Halobacteriales archaeon QS_5_70_15]